MDFDKSDNYKKLGKFIGFVVMFFIFTTILFFVLKFFEKLPSTWGYLHIIFVSSAIILAGKAINLWLK